MTTLPKSDFDFLLDLRKDFGLSEIIVSEESNIFSDDLINKVKKRTPEMEGYYSYIHLMELGAELLDKAKKYGPFLIKISDSEVEMERM